MKQVSGKVFQTAFRDRKIPFNVHGVAFYRKKVSKYRGQRCQNGYLLFGSKRVGLTHKHSLTQVLNSSIKKKELQNSKVI